MTHEKMIEKYEDFIGTYENVYEEGFCQHIISEFDSLKTNSVGYSRHDEGCLPHLKNDYIIHLNSNYFNYFNKRDVQSVFWNGLSECLNRYIQQYSVLKDIGLICSWAKIQQTSQGGGYHLWHSEKENNILHRDRYLVYIFYLNSLSANDGGETEFLYQRKRITPKENTLIIFPSIFTHTHKGNLVLSNVNKYIVTGWITLN